MRSKRSLLVLLIGTLAIVVLALSVSFAQQVMAWNVFGGQPAIQITNEPLYYVWHDGGGWHVRWSSIGINVFSGQITTSGQFTDVRTLGRLASWVIPTGGRLVFLTPTVGGIDGFDFRTTGDAMTFNLLVNQRSASPHQVVVGSGQLRALAMPFTVTTAVLATGTGAGSGDRTDLFRGPDEDP